MLSCILLLKKWIIEILTWGKTCGSTTYGAIILLLMKTRGNLLLWAIIALAPRHYSNNGAHAFVSKVGNRIFHDVAFPIPFDLVFVSSQCILPGKYICTSNGLSQFTSTCSNMQSCCTLCKPNSWVCLKVLR